MMGNKTLLAMFEADEKVQSWFRDAAAAGWTGLDDIADSAMAAYGDLRGFWWCNSCNAPIVNALVLDYAGRESGSEAVRLLGDVTLCRECHEAAKANRTGGF